MVFLLLTSLDPLGFFVCDEPFEKVDFPRLLNATKVSANPCHVELWLVCKRSGLGQLSWPTPSAFLSKSNAAVKLPP